MKSTFTYIAIVSLLLALAIGLVCRGTRSPVLDGEQAASLFGKGMPPSLMTRAAHMDLDTEEISMMVEQIHESIKSDSWLQSGGSFRNVMAGDLVEVDEPEGQYILTMTLLWRDQEISNRSRYFRSHPRPDGQLEGRPFEYLGCSMSSRGFFSGYCECSGISSTKVAIDPNWTFDDRDNNVVSKFKQSFVATLGSNGNVDCENEATISWKLEDKPTP